MPAFGSGGIAIRPERAVNSEPGDATKLRTHSVLVVRVMKTIKNSENRGRCIMVGREETIEYDRVLRDEHYQSESRSPYI